MTPPADLDAAIAAAVENNPSPTPLQLLEAAERMLDKVLQTDCDSRATALDLLTADALTTRALELAAADATLLRDFPELAMRRLASREV